MRQAVAVAVLASMLLVISAPALAGGDGNEFYPGDAPPSACQAGGGMEKASGNNSNLSKEGTPDNGASGGNIDKAYEGKDCD
jgi:hypothetical protein